jgi:hypothetical protein
LITPGPNDRRAPYDADSQIEYVAKGLLDLSLPKAEWTHAAHFAATLWLMRERPDIDLPTQLSSLIRAYNEATGVPNTDTGGYHETITQASIRAARAFLEAFSLSRPLHVVVAALMASPLGERDWLLAYWSKDRLSSVEARRNWVDPDIAALPF